MANSETIVFYDIASGPPVRPFAPNPWKTRYALNFKGVDYRTQWVELPDVTSTRKSLGAAPVRFFGDGSPFYTLPVIKNATTGEVIGDSFEIAVYLDKKYPDGPQLMPRGTIGLHAAFNAQVDAIVAHAGALLFSHGLPLNPETAEVSKADFVRRSGAKSWDELTVQGDARKRVIETFKTALGDLAKFFRCDDGPFLEGNSPTYADLIIGGWLAFLKVTLKEWDELETWHGGRWRKLYEALEKYAEVK